MNNKLIHKITPLIFLISCADPINLTMDENYCITDLNGGVIVSVEVSKFDSSGRLICNEIGIKRPDKEGRATLCLFQKNEWFDEIKFCTLEKGFKYRVIAANLGHSDTVVFQTY